MAVDIDDLVGALVVYRTRGVQRLDGVVGHLEVFAGAGLIAERPHEDRGVVLVVLNVVDVALDVRFLPRFHVAQRLFFVAHAVRLDIRLADHVEAVAVAKLVPVVVAGIVRRTDGVDVVLLEHQDVFEHLFARYRAPVLRSGLVTVDALELDGLAVEKELAVADVDAAEADLAGTHVLRAVIGKEGENQRVKVGIFRRPKARRQLLIGRRFATRDNVGTIGCQRELQLRQHSDATEGGVKEFALHGGVRGLALQRARLGGEV